MEVVMRVSKACLLAAVSFCYFFASFVLADEPQYLVFDAAGQPNGKHIVLVSGDEEYRSEESCPMLAKILSQKHGFKCTVLFAIDKETGCINPYQLDNIPGLETLATADLMVLATRLRKLPDDQLEHFLQFINAAKPFVAYRTATHAFRKNDYGGFEWGHFGKNLIGEDWLNHHGDHKVQGGRGFVVPENADHPILNSVSDVYTPSDIYGIKHLDQETATVLLRGGVLELLDPASKLVEGEKNDPMMPLAWVKSYPSPAGGQGKCFATTAGAAVDFRSEDLRRMIVNACYHLTEQEVPTKADVEPVDLYEPSFYGFVSGEYYRERDLRVTDFELGKSTNAMPIPRLQK
jgi:hypothetical protein